MLYFDSVMIRGKSSINGKFGRWEGREKVNIAEILEFQRFH
jgi:hypothetical protein